MAANALLEQGTHCMMVGQAADKLAEKLGMDMVANEHFTTPFRYAHWERSAHQDGKDTEFNLGTVGAIVLDRHGHLAAAGSTGGSTGKLRGRVGDTAVLGAGLYADSKVAVVW